MRADRDFLSISFIVKSIRNSVISAEGNPSLAGTRSGMSMSSV